jgi:RNA polymerase sigma-70 factor (ECF subfamily)
MSDGSPTSGDGERLAQWVREHGRAVRGYLLGIVRHPDVADDLTQEVFWRAWRSRERYRESGTPRAYLLKIADRLAWDHCRVARREVHLDEETWNQIEPASELAGPADEVVWNESQRELAEALAALSPLQRRVVLLRYFGGLDFAEIARQCD